MKEAILPSRPEVPSLAIDRSTPPRRLKVCIASFDFLGPIRNGGVGTAFTSLGEALAAAGHDVCFLYLSGEHCETDKPLDHWIAQYREKGIEFVPLPEQSGPKLETTWHMAKSYEAYQWLRLRAFDIIHFSEWRAPGYFSLVAKHQGLAFESTVLCVHTHGPTMWSLLSNGEYVTQLTELELDFMERESARLADVLVSPSQYLVRWMLEQGWVLPPGTFVQQYIRPTAAARLQTVHRPKSRPKEIVFFGRIEIRKGLVLFCDALDKLKLDPAMREMKITFLGKLTKIHHREGIDYLHDRAAAWPWEWEVISDRDQYGAVEYLQQPGRVAVIPSIVDNLPNTVLECLGAGVPFLASTTGGIPEMIHASERADILFPLNAAAFAEKIRTCVAEGIGAAHFAVEPEDNRAVWLDWHACLAKFTKQNLEVDTRQPRVSVCISHFNRPEFLRQAIASLETQTYRNLEVIVVDDASNLPDALAYIGTLPEQFAERGWKLIRNNSELFVGAARNIAASHATGEYIMFMDDDNVAKPHEVETFVRVALRTNADVVSCALDFFTESAPPSQENAPHFRFLFLGAAASASALRNYYGDTNSLFRREVFYRLGGFHEQRRVGHEDWKLLGDAVLSGYRLETIPEALVWYRRLGTGENASVQNNLHSGHMANIQPYLDAVPPALRNLILYAQGVTVAQQMAPGDESAAMRYAELTILWRSKLEAGIAIAASNPKLAIDLMVQAIKAVELCKHPRVILEALLGTTAHLGKLDPGRARFLLGFAVQLAEKFHRKRELELARQLLAGLPNGSQRPQLGLSRIHTTTRRVVAPAKP